MDKPSLLAVNLLLILLFWGVSLWIYHSRSRPVKINTLFPLIAKYKKQGLHPLVGDKSDVAWLALWMFLLGSLFFLGLLVNLFL
ncbi:MAG: hypothetical protein GTN70_09630 [Deltaproteobacteria bacterium]|nr:hypothetical protein [Deltaproteobacteria bacterium]NIS78038.1 hypothetical protein [Deltaproteobacteria bacterium]